MITVENVVQETTKKDVVNVSREANALLKTMVLLDRSYSMDYLITLVRGERPYPLADESHSQLETFGSLGDKSFFLLRPLMHCLYDFGLVDAANPTASRLMITEKGRKFVENVSPLELPESKLRFTRYGYLLENGLRRLCRQLASEYRVEHWRVMTEFAIGRIVRKRPATLQELKQIPGITLYKAERFGEHILAEINIVKELRAVDFMKKLKKRVQMPTYQETKNLFLTGRTVQQIAQLRGLKEVTVRDYLMSLHQAGEIDLRPWIEQQVDAKTLYKGGDYFRSVQSPRFREAYETLGLDYETLMLCKLYVSDYHKRSQQLDME